MQQGDHGHQDGVEHHLQACKGKANGGRSNSLACRVVEARLVEQAREQLEPDDGEDDDDEEDEQRDVEQRDHGHQDGVKHNLKAFIQKEIIKVNKKLNKRKSSPRCGRQGLDRWKETSKHPVLTGLTWHS